jgi:hypothetical protein
MRYNTPIALLCLLTIALGCGKFGAAKGVTNEQIDADLENKQLKFPGATTGWTILKNVERCFLVGDGETKITDSTADVPMTFSSWDESTLGGSSFITTVSGKVVMHYKSADGKWILDRIEPKEGVTNGFTEKTRFDEFLNKHVPVCKGYRHPSS